MKIDLLERLIAMVQTVSSVPVVASSTQEGNCVSVMQQPSSQKALYMDGSQERAMPFQLTVKHNNPQQAERLAQELGTLLATEEACGEGDNIMLLSSNGTYEYNKHEVSTAPFFIALDEQQYYYYGVGVTITITIEKGRVINA